MDPLLSYLTAQHMVSQQLGFPLLQTGAVPMTLQASPLFQPAVSTAQLIGMDASSYFKPAAIPVQQPELLQFLQLLNNNGLGAVMTPPPQMTVVAPPAPIVEKAPPTPNQAFLNLFEQLVAANSLQHPLFVDQASAFAALTVPQTPTVTPLNLASFLMPQTTVHHTTVHHTTPSAGTTTVYQSPPTVLQAPSLPTTPTTTTVYQTPITVLQAPPPLPTVVSTVKQQLPALQQQSIAFRPPQTTTATVLPQPTVLLRSPTVPSATATVPLARALPVIRIGTPEKPSSAPAPTTMTAFRVVTPSRQATAPPPPVAASPPAQIKQEVCSPVKSCVSQMSVDSASTVTGGGRSTVPSTTVSSTTVSSLLGGGYSAGTVASTSKSSSVSVDEEMEMSGEEEERYRPEDAFAGRQRRADHIAFHRKMKALLKGLRGADLICRVCAVRVERHDNAFKAHIAEHAAAGANQLECRYCGYETPSRVEMNLHMGDRHPHGSERAYTDKRDHLKMIEIMNECFAKVPRPPKPMVAKRDPALVKPRNTRKRREAAAAAAASASAEEAPAASATPAAPPPPAADDTPATASDESFEQVIVRFCTETSTTEVKCGCGDAVPLNPSALLQHVKTLHAVYRCDDCGDVLHSAEMARAHTVKMHGGDERTVAERIVDHLMVRSVQQRFTACFLAKKEGGAPLAKSHSVRVLQNMMDDELAERSKIKPEIKEEIKEEPADA